MVSFHITCAIEHELEWPDYGTRKSVILCKEHHQKYFQGKRRPMIALKLVNTIIVPSEEKSPTVDSDLYMKIVQKSL